jgi:hypothetical protein
MDDYPHISPGFEQDDTYCIRVLYDYNYSTVRIAH